MLLNPKSKIQNQKLSKLPDKYGDGGSVSVYYFIASLAMSYYGGRGNRNFTVWAKVGHF